MIPIRVGRAARRAAARTLRALRALARERSRLLGPSDMVELQGHYEEFYSAVREDPANHEIQCARGCSRCCSQMVFEVRALEVEVLGQHLRDSGQVDRVRAALQSRLAAYDEVRLETGRDPGESRDDWIERVALRFLARDLPCVFLEADGACGVHALRPYACRRFFSLSDPELCGAAGVTSPDYRGVMVEPHADLDRWTEVLDGAAPFDPGTDLLDRALLRWIDHRS